MRAAWAALALLAAPAAVRAQADTPPLQAVLANGYRFAFADRGSGPPLLLVHGALTDLRFWTAQLDGLAGGARVLALSRRAHYPNPWRPEDPPAGFTTTAADLAAIIRALRLERPVVMVHSWAAPAALELARRFPGLVGGLVLVNPVVDSLIPDPARRAAVAAARRQAYDEALQVFDARAPGPAVNRLLAAWFGPGITLEALPGDTRERLLANAQTLPTAAAPQPAISCAELQSIDLPVLLLGSADGPPEERGTLATLARCLPRAQLHSIPLGGRTLPRSQPDSVNAAVRDFMQPGAP
ncbi:MAG: alpha/beta hydrolase [Gemmatimonadetes bacterium]|jgi:pimeloyl-ACP methyl ester carboxylesterase|nr:alpha/beta hydrolase [Gemmatimonadota bacterium]MBK7925200.1 alpha/beta hydrolase [Gemmatimonadota bacterium]MBP6670596.1 alpha/beta hydrolase [Gemmatimonadales bacterium]MBP9200741.1 alpha/beta hydrolase [Gemmatimonadales bacterium]